MAENWKRGESTNLGLNLAGAHLALLAQGYHEGALPLVRRLFPSGHLRRECERVISSVERKRRFPLSYASVELKVDKDNYGRFNQCLLELVGHPHRLYQLGIDASAAVSYGFDALGDMLMQKQWSAWFLRWITSPTLGYTKVASIARLWVNPDENKMFSYWDPNKDGTTSRILLHHRHAFLEPVDDFPSFPWIGGFTARAPQIWNQMDLPESILTVTDIDPSHALKRYAPDYRGMLDGNIYLIQIPGHDFAQFGRVVWVEPSESVIMGEKMLFVLDTSRRSDRPFGGARPCIEVHQDLLTPSTTEVNEAGEAEKYPFFRAGQLWRMGDEYLGATAIKAPYRQKGFVRRRLASGQDAKVQTRLETEHELGGVKAQLEREQRRLHGRIPDDKFPGTDRSFFDVVVSGDFPEDGLPFNTPIMAVDFVKSTIYAKRMGRLGHVQFTAKVQKMVLDMAVENGLFVFKFVGDGAFLAAWGGTNRQKMERMYATCVKIQEEIPKRFPGRKARASIHFGVEEATLIAATGDVDVIDYSVAKTKRMESKTPEGRILVSREAVLQLLDDAEVSENQRVVTLIMSTDDNRIEVEVGGRVFTRMPNVLDRDGDTLYPFLVGQLLDQPDLDETWEELAAIPGLQTAMDRARSRVLVRSRVMRRGDHAS